MGKSKLYFADARSTTWEHWYSLPSKLEELLDQADISKYIEKGEYVAVKIHLGSPGAFRVVRPTFVRRVVEAIKAVGGKPFIAETTRIPGLEYLEVAAMNGYTHLTCGAPIVMADGIFGRDTIQVKVDDAQFIKEIGVASAIYDAPAMVVLTHCKGHLGSGYGGAIKNIGMGAIGVRTRDNQTNRGLVHSTENRPPSWDRDKCSWCRSCEEICPKDAISIDVDEEIWEVSDELCDRCGRCVRVCPEDALELPMSDELFAQGLAETTKAALSTFKPGKILYVNFLTEISPECDCMPIADTPVVQDQGVLVGDDIVAIDQASLDMINKAEPLPQSKGVEQGKEKPGDIFWGINHKRSQLHIDAAFALGLGNKEYEIIKIERKRNLEEQ